MGGVATWADQADPAYLRLLHAGAVTITTVRLPLDTPIGVTTALYLWVCPDCERVNELDRGRHPATQPAILDGHPSMFRAPFDSSYTLSCPCGREWTPHMLAPYDRDLDEYQLVCTG